MTNDNVMQRMTGLILEEQTELTLPELSRACAVKDEFIIALVEEGVITPAGETPDQWRFTGLHLSHARVVMRLQRDLGVNLAGAALALQLMEEIETLQAQLSLRDGSGAT